MRVGLGAVCSLGSTLPSCVPLPFYLCDNYFNSANIRDQLLRHPPPLVSIPHAGLPGCEEARGLLLLLALRSSGGATSPSVTAGKPFGEL